MNMGMESAFNNIMDGMFGAITGKATKKTTATVPVSGMQPQQNGSAPVMQNMAAQTAQTMAPQAQSVSPVGDVSQLGQQVAALQEQVNALQTYMNQMNDYLQSSQGGSNTMASSSTATQPVETVAEEKVVEKAEAQREINSVQSNVNTSTDTSPTIISKVSESPSVGAQKTEEKLQSTNSAMVQDTQVMKINEQMSMNNEQNTSSTQVKQEEAIKEPAPVSTSTPPMPEVKVPDIGQPTQVQMPNPAQ